MSSKPSLEEFAEGQITADTLRPALLKKPLSLDEIAAKFKVSRGRALDLCDELKAQGYLICNYGGRYSIERSPLPKEEDAFKMVSDKQGRHRFGVVADTHLGSKHERLDILNEAYDTFAAEGITKVYHCGNWIDGEARFNKHEIHKHGFEAQIDYFVEKYPRRKGITTYYVTGDDHEGWYAQAFGIDVGQRLQDTASRAGRKDLVHLGYMEAFIALEHKVTGNVSRMLVCHPGGGSAYAISYALQKIVESYQGGEKPAVGLYGHYHKEGYFNVRNVHAILVPCMKDLDTFGRKKKLEYRLGFVRVELQQDERGAITDCLPKFRQYFDRGYYNQQWNLGGAVRKVKA